MPHAREIKTFIAVGILAAIAHYGMLVGLVEGAKWQAVPATLVGYVAGGIVSYVLNRRHTFASRVGQGCSGRSHRAKNLKSFSEKFFTNSEKFFTERVWVLYRGPLGG